ncbi:MAG TPA: acyl-CoA dehydrogenase family protein, partial [Caulobacteraceae bacterium]|nr:acyl-CoA dehydrogenase family protein [Caulobacteraceae bacterium]
DSTARVAPRGRTASSAADLIERARRVAAVSGQFAVDVDRHGRFPAEAIAAAKAEGLMGVMAPKSLGGLGVGLSELSEVCYTLAQGCAATAMIYAMHQVKVACVVRHGTNSPWIRAFIRKLTNEQLLIASSTTEGKGGGDVRSSEAPVERDGSRISLQRDATVISYGAQADAIVTTARRAADSAASDQVLVVLLASDYTLEPTLSWDALGMRGTCSGGFNLVATGDAAQVMATPYEAIHGQSMVPAAHILWASTWAGIAAAAVEKARKYLRKSMKGGADLPPSAPYFSRATASLRALRAMITTMVDRYEAITDDPDALSTMEFQTAISLLKVDASELAVQTVMSALRVGGLSSYRNDTDVSIGRHLRDVLSSPIMINNDRILANVATATLLSDVGASLRS